MARISPYPTGPTEITAVAARPAVVPQAPGAWPVLGHIVPILRAPLEFLPGLARYGDVVKVRFGRLAVYVVAHPDAVRDVLVPGDLDYRRGLCFERLEPGLGQGIATASGAEHRRLRGLLQPVFSRERVVEYASIMRACAEEAVASWQDGQTMAADEVMNDLALTALTRSLFRFTPDAETAEAIKDGMRLLTHGLLKRIVLPPAWERVPTPGNVRFRRAMARMNRAVGEVITAYRDAGEDRGDVLSALLAARDDDGGGLSDQEVHAQVMTLALTGVEAPGATLGWMMYEIGRNEEVAAQVNAEIDAVLRGRPPHYDDVPALTYLGRVVSEILGGRSVEPADLPALRRTEAFVLENLRLHHPLWMLMRRAVRPVTLGGVHVAPGTEVMYSPAAMHRDPAFFPDADRLCPRRWLDDTGERRAFIPFGLGSRQCIGDRFALAQMVITLATVVAGCRLTLPAGYRPKTVVTSIVHLDRLPMIVRPRTFQPTPAPEGDRA